MGKEKKHKEHKTDKREKYEELPVSRPPSLKLVLKVGGSPVPECSEPRAETPPAPAVAPLRLNMAAISEAETQHKERKHKKKKKKEKEKEKHKHKKDRRQQEEQSPGPETGRESRQSSGTEEAPSQGTASSPEPGRALSPPLALSTDTETAAGESETPAAAEEDPDPDGRPPLRRFLEHLLRGLQEKDTRGFFSVPVTDDVAPGYSSIIDTPMDFSTIAGKVRDGQYAGLAAFKEDFRLMCCNAMTYNRMDTIYYRTAKRLLHIGSKMMSSDKVIELRSVLPYMASLSPEVLGVEPADLMDQDDQPRPQPPAQPAAGQADTQPALKMEVELDEPAQPAEQETSPPAATEPEQVESEPEPQSQTAELGPVPATTEKPEPEAMVVDAPTQSQASQPAQQPRPAVEPAQPEPVRQTRRQTRGGDLQEPETVESRQTRQTRGGDLQEPETIESRPTRQTRGGDLQEPETIESRPTRQTRGGDLQEPETIESRPTRQTRAAEKPEPEPVESRQSRQARVPEQPKPEPADGRQTRHARAAEPPEQEQVRQTRQGRAADPPEQEVRQTRQGRAADPPEQEVRQTRQARAAEPQEQEQMRQTRQGRAAEPPEQEQEQVRQTRQGRAAGPPEQEQVRQTRQVRATEPPEQEQEVRQTRQARVADPAELEQVRQTRRSAVEPPKPADSRPSRQSGAPEPAEAEPMDTSEGTESVTSNLIMKQPHLVLEKIDAEAGMKFRRGQLRSTRGLSIEETAAAKLAKSSLSSQPPKSPQRTQSASHSQPVKSATPADLPRPQQKTSSGKLGFLRQRVDGTTSLAIVAPTGGGERSERVATLGALTGRLSQGAPHLPTFRDDKRNQAKPVKPLYYGAYSSFAPSYDSTFATVSYSESELLFETLAGGPTSQQLAHSVRQAADDCDIAIEMVDSVLDALTDGQHRRVEQRRRLADEIAAMSTSPPSAAPAAAASPAATPAPAAAAGPAAAVDFTSLRTLGELGIDVGFLDGFEAEDRRYQDTQGRLDHTSELISSLNTAQLRRLSQPPEAALPPLSQHELQLADEVTSSLAELVRHVQPGQVAPAAAIRKAIGVGVVPDNQVSSTAAAPTAPGPAPAAAPAGQPPRPASPTTHPSLRTLLSRM